MCVFFTTCFYIMKYISCYSQEDDGNLYFRVTNYDGDLTKFYLLRTEVTLELLMQEISMAFKLKPGTFRIKYYDENGDLASMRTDRSMWAGLRILKDKTKTKKFLPLIVVLLAS